MGAIQEMMIGLVVCLSLVILSNAQLQVGYYNSKCMSAEYIVKGVVNSAVANNPGLAAGLVRMHFHDCFVRGCDGSVLIDSTASNTAEKDSRANNPSLHGFEVIDAAKSKLEGICKGVVSCADILAFAARDSVEQARGFGYDVPAGRKDGRISLASDTPANIPAPTMDVNQLTQLFSSKGLDQTEMVTLSGAHSIGRSHCTSFTNRLYNFNSTTSQDPSLDPTYANQLKQECPQGSTDPNSVVLMDPTNPTVLNNGYYSGLLNNRGLFTSDQTLMTNTATESQVNQNAASDNVWKNNFSAAMVKMGQIGVLTRNNGEIRLNCRVVN